LTQRAINRTNIAQYAHNYCVTLEFSRRVCEVWGVGFLDLPAPRPASQEKTGPCGSRKVIPVNQPGRVPKNMTPPAIKTHNLATTAD
jgi:hypothetical protein